MKTIKITNENLYNECVIDASIEQVSAGEYDLELELTEKGMQRMFPENWEERSNRVNITGEFGQFDYEDELGFQIV